MYENLAAKYRPRNLSEVLGQETIKTTLANSVRLERLAHAYIFYGPRGCGKTTIARILAKTLNCQKPRDGTPCDKCPSCLEIAESKSLDVIEIDAASNTGVENVRDVIIDQAGLAPSRDKYKVYILDEVHMLSKGAFNALLKIIEEPPSHVVFIMATTEQTKVPSTITSRSQCFRFRPISEELMAERLKEVAAKEKLKASGEALAMIAGAAGGAMRDALTLLDRAASFGKGSVQTELLNELLGHAGSDLITALAAALVKRDPAALCAAFEKTAKEGYDPLTVLRDLRNATAETFLYLQKFSKTKTPLAEALDKDLPPAALARLSRKLNAVIDEVKFSDSPSLAAEMALFTLAETPHDLDGLVRRLEALEGRLASGPSAMPGAPPPAQKKNERLAPHDWPALSTSPPSTPFPSADLRAGRAGPSDEEEARPGVFQAPHPGLSVESAGQALPSSALWKKLLSAVSSDKPVLHNILLSVKVAFEQDHSWKLSAGNKFEAGIIEKYLRELEETMERVSGRKIKFAVDRLPAAPASAGADDMLEGAAEEEAVIVEDAAPSPRPERSKSAGRPPQAEAGPATAPGADAPAPPARSGFAHQKPPRAGPEVRWQDMDASAPLEEAELKKLSKVFHGRIARIQKLK